MREILPVQWKRHSGYPEPGGFILKRYSIFCKKHLHLYFCWNTLVNNQRQRRGHVFRFFIDQTERKSHWLEALSEYQAGSTTSESRSLKGNRVWSSRCLRALRGDNEWSGESLGQLGWNRAVMHPYMRDAWLFCIPRKNRKTIQRRKAKWLILVTKKRETGIAIVHLISWRRQLRDCGRRRSLPLALQSMMGSITILTVMKLSRRKI